MSGNEAAQGPVQYRPSVSVSKVITVLPAPVRFKQIEEKLRTSLKDWDDKLVALRAEMQKQLDEGGAVPMPWFGTLASITHELQEAMASFHTIKEDLEAAKVEADYGSVLVGSWPDNHYLDRMAYIGGALIGTGGATFLYGTGILRENPFWFVPAVVLWSVGLGLLGYALSGLADWERGKFDFFAWKLAVPDEYRPRIFRNGPFRERLKKLPEQLRAKVRPLHPG